MPPGFVISAGGHQLSWIMVSTAHTSGLQNSSSRAAAYVVEGGDYARLNKTAPTRALVGAVATLSQSSGWSTPSVTVLQPDYVIKIRRAHFQNHSIFQRFDAVDITRIHSDALARLHLEVGTVEVV